jgi:hypothetical protein
LESITDALWQMIAFAAVAILLASLGSTVDWCSFGWKEEAKA